MVTRTSFWRLLATVSFPDFVFRRARRLPRSPRNVGRREEATHFDYSNSHAFPTFFLPTLFPFVPGPRLDNSRRLQNLIVDGKLMLSAR